MLLYSILNDIQSIKSLLDSMAYAKLNVFHWHVVDTQSCKYIGTCSI